MGQKTESTVCPQEDAGSYLGVSPDTLTHWRSLSEPSWEEANAFCEAVMNLADKELTQLKHKMDRIRGMSLEEVEVLVGKIHTVLDDHLIRLKSAGMPPALIGMAEQMLAGLYEHWDGRLSAITSGVSKFYDVDVSLFHLHKKKAWYEDNINMVREELRELQGARLPADAPSPRERYLWNLCYVVYYANLNRIMRKIKHREKLSIKILCSMKDCAIYDGNKLWSAKEIHVLKAEALKKIQWNLMR